MPKTLAEAQANVQKLAAELLRAIAHRDTLAKLQA